MSLVSTRFRVWSSISLPESPSRPGNQVAAEAMYETALMALKRFQVVFRILPRSASEPITSRLGLSATFPKTEPPKAMARPRLWTTQAAVDSVRKAVLLPLVFSEQPLPSTPHCERKHQSGMRGVFWSERCTRPKARGEVLVCLAQGWTEDCTVRRRADR